VTEWYKFHAKLHDLRRNMTDKGVEHTLDMLFSLLSQIVSRHERDLLESGQTPLQQTLNESRAAMLTARIEALEADASRDRRRIEKHLQAISDTLDTIGQRLPEPPHGFDG